MYKIDLLRQIEANTRGGALSDCYFAPDLWRMIERNTRTAKPVLPPYQLANGLWDMSERELVSFTRSTKAWLDGVEYAPDEPRYKNGKLLVEAQATNIITLPLNGTFNIVVSADNLRLDLTSTRADEPYLQNYDPVPDADTYSWDYYITSEHDISFVAGIFYGEGTGVDYTAKAGIKTRIQGSGSVVTGGVTGSYLIVGKIIGLPMGGKITIENLQFEKGVKSTSSIPLAANQQTRAADIATVRDKS